MKKEKEKKENRKTKPGMKFKTTLKSGAMRRG